MPGSRHTPTARPACDSVTAEPGQSLLTRPTAETAAPRPPFLTVVGAPRYRQVGGRGETLQPLEARLADLDRQRLRAAMGAEAFEAEYAAGRTLDLARVAHEALQGRQARPAAQRAGALVSEPDADISDEAESVLTPRELEVLKLVALGLSNSDVAQRLVLSEHTVHRHLANILRKLDLTSRAAAAAWAVRAGLV